MPDRSSRDYLIDVSRLIWRVWEGKLPTGIDRVCLEYVGHFGDRSQAVVQFRSRIFVLGPRSSDRIFALLLGRTRVTKLRLAMLLPKVLAFARRLPPGRGMIYLNVGHTGLNDSALPQWIAANGVRGFYLIHDLIPMTHPQFCRPGEAQKHERRIRNALGSATGIIGNSQATLDELAAFAAEQSLPMPPTIAAWISGYRPASAHAGGHSKRPYFVTLGTIEGRKNHIVLLHVWKRLASEMGAETPLLVIVGQRGWEAERTIAILDDREALGGHVQELADCHDRELEALIGSARALLMPSFTEGFGLPVIEALAAGTPVIATDLPVYREIVGNIPTYLDPADQAAWAKAVKAFAADGPERKRQKKAMAMFSPPTWERHFATVEKWLDTFA